VEKLPETIDWPYAFAAQKAAQLQILFLIAVLVVLVLASRTAISYWVDLLWFRSLGYGEVFWKTRGLSGVCSRLCGGHVCGVAGSLQR